jgi:hypothetical protein
MTDVARLSDSSGSEVYSMQTHTPSQEAVGSNLGLIWNFVCLTANASPQLSQYGSLYSVDNTA